MVEPMNESGEHETLLRLVVLGSRSANGVEIILKCSEGRRQATVKLPLELAVQDEEDLRWYLEDFQEFPEDPAPKIASRVEKRLRTLGAELFRQLFDTDNDARELWGAVRRKLATTRIEIVSPESFRVPWEIILDPATNRPLAIDARAFVRVPEELLRNKLPVPGLRGSPLRVLMVVSRPDGDTDVPFRSVAAHVVRKARHVGRRLFVLQMLRPPTFEQLERVLTEACDAGQPFQAVHFDGHGIYEDLRARRTEKAVRRPRGYLVFESSEQDGGRQQLIDGGRLGRMLSSSDISFLVLNACRSAHAEPQQEPFQFDDEDQKKGTYAQTSAWDSLAKEVVDAGIPCVVAMRYNVYVATAATFVAEFYEALAQGCSPAEAATRSRRRLFDEPQRSVGFKARHFQDWPVPLIYESVPSPSTETDASRSGERKSWEGTAADDSGTADLPAEPAVGFHGRDATLLALDRAFDRHNAALLHGEAGGGKTTTAVELIRWFTETGGHSGTVLFTSFETPRSLAQVLDQLALFFVSRRRDSGYYQDSKVPWLSWSLAQRRQAVLELMNHQSIFWIWDNVETVASQAIDRQGLSRFLRDAAGTRARFLLTSRGAEKDWLGDDVARIALPAMEPGQCFQLARALIERRSGNAANLEIQAPLLKLSGGNPLVLEVILGQASRQGIETREDVEALIERLRRGVVDLVVETGSDHCGVALFSGSNARHALKASVLYGFDHAFEPAEGQILALLAMFQGFVDTDVLIYMGDPQEPWSLPGLSNRRDILVALLGRATDLGLLTASRQGEGTYRVHPILPWFFRRHFERYYGSDDASRRVVERAWVEAMGRHSNSLFEAYSRGDLSRIHALRAEEANLLEARRLALRRGWWHRVTSAMQGLYGLYDYSGRLATWASLVEEVVPAFCDSQTGGPLPGREQRWGLVMGYRARLARQKGKLDQAQKLQNLLVDTERATVSETLQRPVRELSHIARSKVRSFGAALHELGQIRRELGRSDCIDVYMEAIELAADLGDRAAASACALNLGHVYESIADVRDLDQAEIWYQRSHDVRPQQDRLGRAISLGSLGSVVRERFKEAREQGGSPQELEELLHKAAQLYREDLEALPLDAISHRAVAHVQLGNTLADLGETDEALSHYREAISLREKSGEIFEAASVRFNAARQLAEGGRLKDAELYAASSLQGFAACGDNAVDLVSKTQILIDDIRERQVIKTETREQVESVLGSLGILHKMQDE